MVAHDLAARGIEDAAVLRAMGEVPREEFVPSHLRAEAYDDRPLPIGEGQTISQPYVVALMLELLELAPEDRMLEVGAGSGYAAAVAGRICRRVVGVERLPHLATTAAARLARLGGGNVVIVCDDGSTGWSPEAPYDAVLVSAGAGRPRAARRPARRRRAARGARRPAPVEPAPAPGATDPGRPHRGRPRRRHLRPAHRCGGLGGLTAGDRSMTDRSSATVTSPKTSDASRR